MYLGNSNYVLTNRATQLPHNYIYAGNPTIDVNPPILNMTWLNTVTGEIFVCLGNGIGANLWQGQLGSVVSPSPTVEILETISLPASTGWRDITVIDGDLCAIDTVNLKVYRFSGISNTIIDSIDVVSSQYGLTNIGSNLVNSSNLVNELYIHQGFSGGVSETYSIASPVTENCVGMDYYDDRFYIGDIVETTVVKFNLNGDKTVLDTGAGSAGGVRAVAFNGINLFVANAIDDVIYIFDKFSDILVDSFSTNCGYLGGMYYHLGRLYSLDGDDGTLRIHKNTGEL